MTVTAIIAGHKDKKNKQSIYIRTYENGKRRYKKTPVKITSDDWLDGEVKSTHPQHKLYNQIIRKAIYEAEAKIFLPGPKETNVEFFKYCDDCCIGWKNAKVFETLRQHTSELNKIRKFAPVINLSSITTTWLNKYKDHLFSLGNAANTVHKSLKFVRLIMRKAHKEGLINKNPFDTFEMQKYRDPQKMYLSKEQVEKIETFAFDTSRPWELRFVAAWFSLGVLTGLRYSDLKAFNKQKNIRDGRLIIYTAKTGEIVSMPVSSKIKSLLELIDYKPLHYTNVHYNRLLKSMAVLCELGQPINGHLSRHTATMIWANSGLSQEVVAKLLGHSSLKSTVVYYKISGKRIDEELSKLS